MTDFPALRAEWEAALGGRRAAMRDALGFWTPILDGWAAWSGGALPPLGWSVEECRERWERGVALLAEAPPSIPREALEDLLEDPDPYLRVDVVRALGDIGDSKARPALRARLETDLDPRVRRRIREVLRDLGGEGKKGIDHLREELERLRDEHAELKGRIAKIEARVEPKKKK